MLNIVRNKCVGLWAKRKMKSGYVYTIKFKLLLVTAICHRIIPRTEADHRISSNPRLYSCILTSLTIIHTLNEFGASIRGINVHNLSLILRTCLTRDSNGSWEEWGIRKYTPSCDPEETISDVPKWKSIGNTLVIENCYCTFAGSRARRKL